jgi:glycerol-3-phosphate dehydrogenase
MVAGGSRPLHSPGVTPRPFVRSASLEALRHETFDLVVVGGGVTGAGVVLDAASRGMRAALIERDDFAAGTSSKSSKLIHGGLRYLQQGEIGLVYEALAERQRLLNNAPHLVKPLPFLIPMFGRDGIIPAKIARLLGTAMWGYDLTGGLRIGKLHQRLDKAEALAYMPTLPEQKLVSAYLYYDAAADDARLVLTLARTAALEHGAVVANGVAARGLSKDVGGRIDGVEVEADGEVFTVRSRAVVNAAGVWSDDVRAQDEGSHPDSIRPAKGIHITVPWRLVRNEIAAVIPVPKDKRSVFVVPHGEFTYVGTTDTDYDGPVDDPQCTPEDIDYLLRALNGSCTNEITTADIVGSWAGLRPLVKAAASGRTADLSRKHKVARSRSGLVTITGGKLTTYREMAADTVDEVVDEVLPRHGGADGIGRSRTKKLRLRGAAGYDTLAAARAVYTAVDEELLTHLGDRYGGEARVLMSAIQSDPELAEPLVAGLPYTRAEALFAVRHEMARSVDDVLSRRTRARLYGRDDSGAAAAAVGALIADELGWDAAATDASVASYRAALEHERTVAGLPETHLDALLPDPA